MQGTRAPNAMQDVACGINTFIIIFDAFLNLSTIKMKVHSKNHILHISNYVKATSVQDVACGINTFIIIFDVWFQ